MADEQYLLPEFKPPFWKRVSLDRLLSVSALVIALLSVAFSYLQYRAADREATVAEKGLELAKTSAKNQEEDVRRSREASERSATAAEGSQTAALESSTIARAQLQNSIKLFQIDQRARIAASIARRVNNLEPDKPTTFRVTIRNIGKTPALKLKGQQWIAATTQFRPEYHPLVTEQSVLDVGPGSELIFDNDITIPAAFVDFVKARKVRVWIYGVLTYFDIFDGKTAHSTSWCFMYPPVYGADKTELEVCPVHNAAN